MGRITVGQIRYDLLQINENDGNNLNVDAYLLCGENQAVLIDSLQDTEELFDTVKRLTSLPLSVIITHGHPDHAGKGLKQFFDAGVPVYMHEDDFFLYKDMFSPQFDTDLFQPLHDGDVFDPEGINLKTILCGGHTPGSVVLLDEKNGRLFSGDAVGSGLFWMQIPGCLPLHEFHNNLARLIRRVDQIGSLRVYPGHRWQSPVQLNLQYLKDTLALTGMILRHEDNGRKLTMMYNGEPLDYKEASYGMMLGYAYNPLNL